MSDGVCFRVHCRVTERAGPRDRSAGRRDTASTARRRRLRRTGGPETKHERGRVLSGECPDRRLGRHEDRHGDILLRADAGQGLDGDRHRVLESRVASPIPSGDGHPHRACSLTGSRRLRLDFIEPTPSPRGSASNETAMSMAEADVADGSGALPSRRPSSSTSLALVSAASARCDWCMTPGELAAVRRRLEEFAAEMFASLARRDQRDKGATYVRGSLLDGRRKSMQPMAERLGVDHQGLQQFVSSSTWAVEPVRERLARRAVAVIAPDAWVVDDTGFVKDGTASPGVARQYSGTLGKVGNCQVAVSICAVTDGASCPLNWRLFLPAGWDDTEASTPQEAAVIRVRRARAGLPAEARHREKWRLALDMLEELADWGLAPPVVVGDAGYGDNAGFRDGLSTRGWAWVVQVSGDLSAQAEDAAPQLKPSSGRGRRPLPRYRTTPVGLREHVLAAGRAAVAQLTWREGSRGPMTSHFLVLRVRPAGHHQADRRAGDGSLPAVWLLAQWPPEAAEPTDYWLSSLPEDTSLAELVRLAKIRWRIEHDYRELKTGLGLDHFEGRTWAGWHRHVTLVTAAQLFLTLLRTDPKAAAPA